MLPWPTSTGGRQGQPHLQRTALAAEGRPIGQGVGLGLVPARHKGSVSPGLKTVLCLFASVGTSLLSEVVRQGALPRPQALGPQSHVTDS